MRLNKPIGILLLLWPTMWALWLASNGSVDPVIFTIFVLGVVLMRSAGCVINDIADREIDANVSRTVNRPLAAKQISISSAVILFFILLSAAFGLVLLCNSLTIKLAFIGAALSVIYPFLKRITHLPQMWLGMAFAYGVPMAFAAVRDAVPVNAWFLYGTCMVWPIIYDTMYAMADRPDDIKIGVKSTAILFGQYDRFIIGLLQVIFLGMMVKVGFDFQLGAMYDVSLLLAGLLFIYQQWLIKNREPARCFQAFLNNHWVGLVIFLGILFA